MYNEISFLVVYWIGKDVKLEKQEALSMMKFCEQEGFYVSAI